jgi:hypothetical protein
VLSLAAFPGESYPASGNEVHALVAESASGIGSVAQPLLLDDIPIPPPGNLQVSQLRVSNSSYPFEFLYFSVFCVCFMLCLPLFWNL